MFVFAVRQAGVAKLNEAKALVDELKRKAAEQSTLLKTKQQEADSALHEITSSMQVCMEWFVACLNSRHPVDGYIVIIVIGEISFKNTVSKSS